MGETRKSLSVQVEPDVWPMEYRAAGNCLHEQDVGHDPDGRVGRRGEKEEIASERLARPSAIKALAGMVGRAFGNSSPMAFERVRLHENVADEEGNARHEQDTNRATASEPSRASAYSMRPMERVK